MEPLDQSSSTSASSSQHVIALALHPLPLQALAAAGAVSQLWHEAVAEVHGSTGSLDLSPFAAHMNDELLVGIVSRVPLLRELNVSSCVRITDKGIACLPRLCPGLYSINLACLPLITADGVSAVSDALGAQLTSLELAGCSAISEAALIQRFGRFLELDDDEDGLAKVQG